MRKQENRTHRNDRALNLREALQAILKHAEDFRRQPNRVPTETGEIEPSDANRPMHHFSNRIMH